MQNVRHASRPRLRALLCLTLFGLAPLHGQTAPSTNTLAVYGDAVAAEQLPPGWRFEWNAAGDMGQPVNIIRPPISAAEPRRDADGGYATYAARHEAQCNGVLERKSELVFLGDSITQRWPADLLEEHFGAYRPVNLGIGGDWVQNVLWRVRNGVLDQAPLRVAVLLIGTNNLSNRFTPEEIIQGINAILQAVRNEAPGARVLLLGILPRRGSIDAPLNDKVRAVNAGLAAMADGTHVVYLDVGPSRVEPDGTILPEVMPDQLHVARPGFLRWMKAMQPTLDRMLAGK